jgi:hypothetical protein
MTALVLSCLLLADAPPPPAGAETVPVRELALLAPADAALLAGRPGRFVFVPGSLASEVEGRWQVEAAGPKCPGHGWLLLWFPVTQLRRRGSFVCIVTIKDLEPRGRIRDLAPDG